MGKTTKRKAKKNIARGVVHIKATFNNTHVTITDTSGNAISSSVICKADPRHKQRQGR